MKPVEVKIFAFFVFFAANISCKAFPTLPDPSKLSLFCDDVTFFESLSSKRCSTFAYGIRLKKMPEKTRYFLSSQERSRFVISL